MGLLDFHRPWLSVTEQAGELVNNAEPSDEVLSPQKGFDSLHLLLLYNGLGTHAVIWQGGHLGKEIAQVIFGQRCWVLEAYSFFLKTGR